MYSYLYWLFLFVFLPISILWIGNWRSIRVHKKALLFAAVGGLIFGFPWDYLAIQHHIWYFTKPQIVGVWFWGLPFEEYLFIFLETLFFATITVILLDRKRKV